MHLGLQLLACLVDVVWSHLLEESGLAFVDFPQCLFLDFLGQVFKLRYLLVTLDFHLFDPGQNLADLIVRILLRVGLDSLQILSSRICPFEPIHARL